MSFSNATETDLQNYIFNAVAPSWAGNGNFWLALYTADPGEAGTAITNEATFGGYARVAVVRSAGGWTVSGPNASNTALVQFPICTSGSNTITHVAVVTTASGAGQIIESGALNTSLSVSTNIQPQFNASALTIALD